MFEKIYKALVKNNPSEVQHPKSQNMARSGYCWLQTAESPVPNTRLATSMPIIKILHRFEYYYNFKIETQWAKMNQNPKKHYRTPT